MSAGLTSFPSTSSSSIRRRFNSLPKVKVFLESIERNSSRTRKNYETGLVHLQCFLTLKYDNNYSLESVIQELKDNRLDVYELIDNFITYEVNKQGIEKVTAQSIMAHLVGIKSYLAYHDVDIIEHSGDNNPISTEGCEKGFEFEIKCGKSLCTLPPSRHRDNPYFHYESVGQADKIMTADGLYDRLVNELLPDCQKKRKEKRSQRRRTTI